MKQFLPFFFLLYFCKISLSQTNSLEKGECYKIGITESGIFKMDGSYLKKMGVDLTKIIAKNIHILGNGSGALPQLNSSKRPLGLTENAIFVSNEIDAKFNINDFILFYGQAPHKIEYNVENKTITHQIHPYSDTTFYFLVIDDKPGLRISTVQNEVNKPEKEFSSFDDYYYHELERKNIIGKSGREWFGEELNSSTNYTQSFELKIPGIIPNSVIKFTSAVVGATINEKSNFKILLNDKLSQEIETEAISDYIYGIKGVWAKKENNLIIENPANQKITINLDKNSQNNSRGYLDYFGIQTIRDLQLVTDQLEFRSFESMQYKYSQFILKTNNNISIWDISNPLLPKNQIFNKEANKINFISKTDSQLNQYIAFSENKYLTPQSLKKINNQNIRAYNSPELLIITTKKFKEAAQKLADHRATNDKLLVEVVDIEEVYNDFSSGMADVTAIRDFAKYLYDQPNSKLKYLLLFADASYDVKNNDGDKQYQKLLSDYLPAYQSRESLDNVKSFSSEDYYGFMENNEGEWLESEDNKDNHTLDIGVGRIPVKTVEEAEGVVKKLIYYDTKQETIGNWRTKIVLASDDGDSNLHQNDSEDLAEVIKKKGANYRPEKIYIDAFPRLSGNTNGKLSPEGSKKITDAFKKGALIFNYVGHGGASNLSDEKILTREDISQWQNLNNMPLMVTATCEFGRYDNPGEISGAEMALLNPNGGAIALLTTTRPVYSITNKKINEAFYNSAFESINGVAPRLGDILRPTKNNSFEFVYNRNFTLLGDPSMKLAYPDNKIEITKRNGIGISEKNDTLKALQKIELQGEIRNFRDDFLIKDFNGKAIINIFDKETTFQTLGNNANSPMKYKQFQDKIFEGEATVSNGIFKINFLVPKDIQYKYGNARIEMYAYSNDKSVDALGVNGSFIIGGNQGVTNNDTNPPEITTFLNNSEFKNGDTVGNNPILFVNLKDTSGININSSAVGHEIMAKLDGKINIVLNEFIIPILDNPTELSVKYPFYNLTSGKHQLEITAWDNYNNSSTKTLEFTVKENEQTRLSRVLNFPNPVSDYTTVQFDHNFVGENLNAKISILTVSGKLMGQYNSSFIEADSPITFKIPQKIGNNSNFPKGIYPFKVELNSEKLNKTATGEGKLIVIE